MQRRKEGKGGRGNTLNFKSDMNHVTQETQGHSFLGGEGKLWRHYLT